MGGDLQFFLSNPHKIWGENALIGDGWDTTIECAKEPEIARCSVCNREYFCVSDGDGVWRTSDFHKTPDRFSFALMCQFGVYVRGGWLPAGILKMAEIIRKSGAKNVGIVYHWSGGPQRDPEQLRTKLRKDLAGTRTEVTAPLFFSHDKKHGQYCKPMIKVARLVHSSYPCPDECPEDCYDEEKCPQ